MERYVETTYRLRDLHILKGNTYYLHDIVSLLAYVCIVSLCGEFQSLVDGPGMCFAAGSVRPQASQTCWNRFGAALFDRSMFLKFEGS